MSVEFVKTEILEEATHWIPTYDKHYRVHHPFKIFIHGILAKFSKKYSYSYNLMQMNDDIFVALGWKYKLFKSSDGELAIIDDQGRDINLWLFHKGYFVKEIDTKIECE